MPPSAPTLAQQLTTADQIPSSSPAFGTPALPFKINKANSAPSPKASVLPILLPPSTLRPIAFRTFTRKHNLTISSSALQTLAAFVGKNCGAGWREEGLAERVLDEVAKAWKKAGGSVIVEEGKGASLKELLQTFEGTMHGGRIVVGKSGPPGERGTTSLNLTSMQAAETSLWQFTSVIRGAGERDGVEGEDDHSELSLHLRNWIKVLDAFGLPRISYNVDKKYFETAKSNPTLFPPPSRKTAVFRDRYNLVYQRLLRNEAFQTSSLGSSAAGGPPSLRRSASSFAPQQNYKLTSIANLLGRTGTSHLLLGLLSVSPAGDLILVDLTGSVSLDLTHARMIPEDCAWFCPGMIVLVDGIYEEEADVKGSRLGGNDGVGGTIGGTFVAVSVCGPPCERREVSLGINTWRHDRSVSLAGGFGWVDFLGVGSERAQGSRMRRIQAKCLEQVSAETDGSPQVKIAILSEVNLDSVKVLDGLKKIFSLYEDTPLLERPHVFVVMGNFVRSANINGGGRAGSIEYKEYFDSLAGVLSDFPDLLRRSTFVFVPGDQDPWASAFSAGASTPIPRDPIPDLFTTRVKRAFATANSEIDQSRTREPKGEAIWTSNPSRISLFGPVHDIVIFRDDISGRLQRNSLIFKADEAGNNPDEQLAPAAPNDDPESHGVTTNNSMASRDNRDSAASNHDNRWAREFHSSPLAVQRARKLVKTILDQGTVTPFPLSVRPVLWDFASSLQLYPLPTALILADADTAPFCITYDGCHVMNPGRLVPQREPHKVRWVEYDLLRNRGEVREERY